MGIEKPFEVESGELKPIAKVEHDVRVGERLAHAVRAREGAVEICGMRLRPPLGMSAPETAAVVRETLLTRILERRPNADEATWTRFQEEARGVLRTRTTADNGTLDALRRTIDGL